MPEWAKNPPSLPHGLVEFWLAFCELSTCRPIGFSPGPIPWTAINQFANEMGYSGPDKDDLVYFIREMDAAYLSHGEDQAKKARKTNQARSDGGDRIGGRKSS